MDGKDRISSPARHTRLVTGKRQVPTFDQEKTAEPLALGPAERTTEQSHEVAGLWSYEFTRCPPAGVPSGTMSDDAAPRKLRDIVRALGAISDAPCIAMLVVIPPPVTGMTLVSQSVARRVREEAILTLDLTVSKKVSVTPLAWTYRKYGALCLGTLKIVVARLIRRNSRIHIYMTAESGRGMKVAAILARIASFAGARIVLHHHSWTYWDRASWERRLLFKAVEVSGGTHLVLCRRMAELAKQTAGTATVQVLPNNFAVQDTLANVAPPDRRRTSESFRFGIISNLARSKGVLDLVEVVRILTARGHTVELAIAGPFPDSDVERHVTTAVNAGLPITLHGPLYGSDKVSFLAGLDAFAFPTRYAAEAAPLVLLEAMALGIPIVSYARGCIEEMLAGMESATVVSDAVEMAEALETLIELGRQIPVTWQEHFHEVDIANVILGGR